MFQEIGSGSLTTVSCSEVGKDVKAGICVDRGGVRSGEIGSGSLTTVSCSEVGKDVKAGICVDRGGVRSGSGSSISFKSENGGLSWRDVVGSITVG